MQDTNKNYKSVRVKNSTFKELKLLSIKLETPVTKLIDILVMEYKRKPKTDTD